MFYVRLEPPPGPTHVHSHPKVSFEGARVCLRLRPFISRPMAKHVNFWDYELSPSHETVQESSRQAPRHLSMNLATWGPQLQTGTERVSSGLWDDLQLNSDRVSYWINERLERS